MISLIKKSLMLKILMLLVTILILSFSGLSFSIVKMQIKMVEEMAATVDTKLKATGDNSKIHLGSFEEKLVSSLRIMKEDLFSCMSRSTGQALIREKNQMKEVMNSFVESNLQFIRNSLQVVNQENSLAIQETGDLLADSIIHFNSSITKLIVMIGTACCLLILIGIGSLFCFIILNPLKEISDGLKATAEGEGDLTKRLHVNRTDEIGVLAGWFNAFISRMNNIIVDITQNAHTVTAASTEVLSVSEQMSEDAADLSMRASTVAAATEEMSTSMNSVAAATEQSSTNISIVADSAGDMKATLGEAVQSCYKAQHISENATSAVDGASSKVKLLGEAAKDISKITEVITEIAEQTNLLALNATIEAARAGEAGKGFAVVASEIKNLAAQTTGATHDIRNKVTGIQNSTSETVTEVDNISAVIAEVNEIVSTIAAAIEEQSAAATEVANNIHQASLGIAEINENIAQTSHVAGEVASDIHGVNNVAETMSLKSGQMNSSARDLSDLSSKLRDMISVFKISTDHLSSVDHLSSTDHLSSADRLNKKNDSNSGQKEKRVDYDLITWGPRLETGIKDIDIQHKELVRMINELHKAMKTGAGVQKSGAVLDSLAEYTVGHFSHEEKLFNKYQYPEYREHKKIHETLVSTVVDFQTQFKAGQASLSVDLMNFLSQWLKDHIMKCDMKYVPFFKSKGL